MWATRSPNFPLVGTSTRSPGRKRFMTISIAAVPTGHDDDLVAVSPVHDSVPHAFGKTQVERDAQANLARHDVAEFRPRRHHGRSSPQAGLVHANGAGDEQSPSCAMILGAASGS